MTISFVSYNLGLGIENQTDGTFYRWTSHSFNPSSNTAGGFQTWDYFANPSPSGYYPIIYNVNTVFDLPNFNYGNEVVAALMMITSNVADTGILGMEWVDPDGNTLFSFSLGWSISLVNGWYFSWSGIGVKADGNEIWKDGTYRINFHASSNTYPYQLITTFLLFTVTNYPTTLATPGKAGSIWVEGNNICFACYQGYKIIVANDGTSTYVGTQHAGKIWIGEIEGKITYIDASGYKRNTKLGDRYGYGGWASEIPSATAPSNAGKIWVSSDNNDTYLMIISSSGIKYRLGAGFVGAGDYQ